MARVSDGTGQDSDNINRRTDETQDNLARVSVAGQKKRNRNQVRIFFFCFSLWNFGKDETSAGDESVSGCYSTTSSNQRDDTPKTLRAGSNPDAGAGERTTRLQ